MQISRRTALRMGGAALAIGFTDLAAAAETVVATTYPGSFDEAFKAVVGLAVAKATQAELRGQDVFFGKGQCAAAWRDRIADHQT